MLKQRPRWYSGTGTRQEEIGHVPENLRDERINLPRHLWVSGAAELGEVMPFNNLARVKLRRRPSSDKLLETEYVLEVDFHGCAVHMVAGSDHRVPKSESCDRELQGHEEEIVIRRIARLHLLGPIFAIFAGLFAGKPLYPMTRTGIGCSADQAPCAAKDAARVWVMF